MIDLQSKIQVRDNIYAKLEKLGQEYDRLAGSCTSSRVQARLSHLAKEIERHQKGLERIQGLIEVSK